MNAIKGNVYIIDTAALWLTSDSSATGTFHDAEINAIGFYGTGTTSELGLSFGSANSSDFIHLKTTSPTGGFEYVSFTTPWKISERIYTRVVTAGTGYLYYS